MTMSIGDQWALDRERSLDRIQQDVNDDVSKGHHPFKMIIKLNHTGDTNALGDFPIMRARVTTWNGTVSRYEEVQLDMLEKLGPYWDLCQAHFKSKMNFKVKVERSVREYRYIVTVSVQFYHVDDMDNFKVMSKLHDLPETLELEYK